ncbi:MAG: hypothetical protein JW751_24640 [Polyangiaceae bacterium]|nr:hypothetical protein [Polyangiaceae bacterium]
MIPTSSRTAALLAWSALVAPGHLGCSFDLSGLEELPDAPTNVCELDSDCGTGGHCVGGRCTAEKPDYDEVLLEVSVPVIPAAGSYAGARIFRSITGLRAADGRLDVDVPWFSDLTLTIVPPPCETGDGTTVPRVDGDCPEGSAPPSGRAACRYDLGAVPLEVTLTPTARALGIAAQSYRAVSHGCMPLAPCPNWEVIMRVPPGDYDVYVRVDPAVTAIEDGVCDVVPEIATLNVPDNIEVMAGFQLHEPELLELAIPWDTTVGEPRALEAWTLDMLDGETARRVSNRVRLGEPEADGEQVLYRATIEFLPAPSSTNAAELVRLVPPERSEDDPEAEGIVAPTIVVERSSLGIFSGPAVLDQLTALPEPVEVEGQLLAITNPEDGRRALPVGGTVTLVAKSIDGFESGTFPAFQTTVTADAEEGILRATLLPGTYLVRVLPSASCPEVAPCARGAVLCDCPVGATETEWSVAPTPAVQRGKTVELAWSTRISGWAVSANGAPIAGAPIQATAVPRMPRGFDVVLGTEPFVPRASSGTVASDGSFDLRADAGEYNLSIRPDTSTGFAWLVRSGVSVEFGGPNLEFGRLSLPLPVPYRGTVRVPADRERSGVEYGVLPGAVLRAYLELDPGTVVEVGSATADAAGEFELLLPAHLEQAW